jgi:hypothetical protein
MLRKVKFLVAAISMGLCVDANGQTVSTEILGLVTDSTAAAMSGATITAKRVATGDVRTTTSNETGNYVFPLLEVGDYEVTCAAAGFKTEVRRGVVLELQQKLRLDFQMQIGQRAETVEVAGAAPILRTDDATLGSVIEHRRVVDLPLNGRNFGQLATLTPGVVIGLARMGVDGQGGRIIAGQDMAISANGQRDVNQAVSLDGVVATNPKYGDMQFVFAIEAIEEFKVQSGVYSAEYGMNSGAQTSVVTRSGTNQLHGVAFEFLRNDKLDARGYFLPPEQPKNELRKNQFGGVISGPLLKDKTFWLFNYEGRRERRATPSLITVPTLAMRQGDFSELIQPGNRWYPRDPNPAATRAIRLPGSSMPFPNNIIPASLINPVSNNILTFKKTSPFPAGGFIAYPNIDAQALAQGSTNNLAGVSRDAIKVNQYMGRVDHKFGDNDRLFGRYVIVDGNRVFTPVDQVNQETTLLRGQDLAIGYTKIITPSVLNDFRYGYLRQTDDGLSLWSYTNFTQRDLGLDFRVVPDNNRILTPREEGLPNMAITGFGGTVNTPNDVGRQDFIQVHEFSDSLTVTRGRHNFKFGGVYRYNFLNTGGSDVTRGSLSFTGDIAGIPDGFAAFLLGFPVNARTAEGLPPRYLRQNKYGFYWLDEFKATPRLTINFGVRWDIFGVCTDAQGRIRNLSFATGEARIVPGLTTPGIQANILGYHSSAGAFVPMLVPNPGDKKSLYDINLRQIMPRLGIAYRWGASTVLRMGAGNFYNANQMGHFSVFAQQPPFAGSSVIDNDRTNPQGTIGTIGNPGTVVPTPIHLVVLGNFRADDKNRSVYLNNNIWQWSFQIEKSFGQNLVTSIGYVGSAASHIDIPVSFNNPDPGLGAIQDRRPFPFYVDSRNPNQLLPWADSQFFDTSVSANYNALQLRAEKRYYRGLTFTASFNYQKSLGIGYGANEGGGFGPRYSQDPYDRAADYGRSNIDQRFRFVASHVWEIPWMRNATGLTHAVLGGWSINGIVQLTSGLPVTVTQTGDSQNTGVGSNPRPSVVPAQKVDRVMASRTPNNWFNTNAFVRSKCNGCPGDGIFLGPKGYGNAGVGLFDAPAQKTWDFALFKDFRIKEERRVQFRWESFNFLNTPQLSAPSASLGSSTFGRITSTITNNREMQLALKYIF